MPKIQPPRYFDREEIKDVQEQVFFSSLERSGGIRSPDLSANFVEPLEDDCAQFGRVIPYIVELLLRQRFICELPQFGLQPVLPADATGLRTEFRKLDGFPQFAGQSLIPLFYSTNGSTVMAFAPRQTFPCLFSFVVAVDYLVSGWQFCSLGADSFLRDIAILMANQSDTDIKISFPPYLTD
jgi:hypothetical protein